LENRLALLSQ
jgi:chromosome segregation ATPase